MYNTMDRNGKRKSNVPVPLSHAELRSLRNDTNSCVTMKKCVHHIVLHPFHLYNGRESIKEILNAKVAKFHVEFDGILLGYENIKMFGVSAPMYDDLCYMHQKIEADFYIFKPIIGSILNGIINKKSHIHVGCLVHKFFNISLPKPPDAEYWLGNDAQIGQEVKFRVCFIQLDARLPYIRGELLTIISEDSGISTSDEIVPQKNQIKRFLNTDDVDNVQSEIEFGKKKRLKKKNRTVEADGSEQVPEVIPDDTSSKKKKSKKEKKQEPDACHSAESEIHDVLQQILSETSETSIKKKKSKKRKKSKCEELVEEHQGSYLLLDDASRNKKKSKKEKQEPDSCHSAESEIHDVLQQILGETSEISTRKEKSKKRKKSKSEERVEEHQGKFLLPHDTSSNKKKSKKEKKQEPDACQSAESEIHDVIQQIVSETISTKKEKSKKGKKSKSDATEELIKKLEGQYLDQLSILKEFAHTDSDHVAASTKQKTKKKDKRHEHSHERQDIAGHSGAEVVQTKSKKKKDKEKIAKMNDQKERDLLDQTLPDIDLKALFENSARSEQVDSEKAIGFNMDFTLPSDPDMDEILKDILTESDRKMKKDKKSNSKKRKFEENNSEDTGAKQKKKRKST